MRNIYHTPSDQNGGVREAQHQITKMVLLFGQGEVQLSTTETEALKKWVVTWSVMRRPNMVAMSGVCESSRAGRLRRAHSLILVLTQLGVAAKSIHQHADWMKPTKMGLVDDLPADMVWLELVKSRPGGNREN